MCSLALLSSLWSWCIEGGETFLEVQWDAISAVLPECQLLRPGVVEGIWFYFMCDSSGRGRRKGCSSSVPGRNFVTDLRSEISLGVKSGGCCGKPVWSGEPDRSRDLREPLMTLFWACFAWDVRLHRSMANKGNVYSCIYMLKKVHLIMQNHPILEWHSSLLRTHWKHHRGFGWSEKTRRNKAVFSSKDDLGI